MNLKKITLLLTLSIALVGCQGEEKPSEVSEEVSQIVESVEKSEDSSENSEVSEVVSSNEEAPPVEEEVEVSEPIDVSIVDENKDDEKIEVIKNNEEAQSKFNEELTEGMFSEFQDYSYTLVLDEGVTRDQYPKSNLSAIKRYESEAEVGYVVRYGENRVGYAVVIKGADNGTAVIYDMTNQVSLSGDTPEAYEAIADEVIEKGKLQ